MGEVCNSRDALSDDNRCILRFAQLKASAVGSLRKPLESS